MAEAQIEAGGDAVELNGSAEVANVVVFHSLKLQLAVPAQKAEEAVEFYKKAFGAVEVFRVSGPKRKADQEIPSLHLAEIKIGSAFLIICERSEDSEEAVGVGAAFHLETDEAKAAVDKAVKAGAVLDGDLAEDNGAISGKLKDPFGYVWIINSIEEAGVLDA
ncbi:lactoylglutathione lyase / glyoxalase I family protein [Wolffia australiana]